MYVYKYLSTLCLARSTAARAYISIFGQYRPKLHCAAYTHAGAHTHLHFPWDSYDLAGVTVVDHERELGAACSHAVMRSDYRQHCSMLYVLLI